MVRRWGQAHCMCPQHTTKLQTSCQISQRERTKAFKIVSEQLFRSPVRLSGGASGGAQAMAEASAAVEARAKAGCEARQVAPREVARADARAGARAEVGPHKEVKSKSKLAGDPQK